MCKNRTWNASHLKLLQLAQFNLVTWSIGEILMCLPMMLFFLLIGYAGSAMIDTGLPVSLFFRLVRGVCILLSLSLLHVNIGDLYFALLFS